MCPFFPALIINLQPGSPATGTCQDERHGLEREREGTRKGWACNTSITCLVAREVRCLCLCDVSPTPLSGLAAGTMGRYPDLCVCVFLQEPCVAYMIVWDGLCLFCGVVLEKTIATHQAHALNQQQRYARIHTHMALAGPLPFFMSKNRPFSQWSLRSSKQPAARQACALG